MPQELLLIAPPSTEFAAVADALRRFVEVVVRTPGTAEQPLSGLPDGVVWGISRPRLTLERELQDLQDRFGDVPMVVLLGAWCCGQKRLHKSLPVPARYVHEGTGPLLAAFGFAPPAHPVAPPILTAIYAPSVSYRQGLVELLAAAAQPSVAAAAPGDLQVHGVGRVLWQVPWDEDLREAERRRITRSHPEAKIWALGTFPREHERAELAAHGIQLLAEPLETRELLTQLTQASPQTLRAAA